MRKIDILNKNYEVANLNTVVYEGYSIKQIIEDSPVFDVTPPQHYLDYWQKIYDYLKDGTQLPGHTYVPSGQSKYDIAYINKTIDDPIAELNGHTLREVFESGNEYVREGSTETKYGVTFTNNNDGTWTINGTATQNSEKKISTYFGSTGKYYLGYIPYDNNPNTRLVIWYNNSVSNFLSLSESTSDIKYFDLATHINLTIFPTVISGATVSNLRVRPIAVNMDNFGIGSLTKTIMDYYYSLYLARKNITKKQLTYADIFELNYLDNYNQSSVSNAVIILTNNNMDWEIDYSYTTPIQSWYARRGGPDGIQNKRKLWITFDFISRDGASSMIHDNVGYNWDISVNLVANNRYSIIATPHDNQYNLPLYIRFNGSDFNNVIIKNVRFVNLDAFDELITKEQLDLLRAYYLIIKYIVIYPENFIPLEPTGFGNRYKFKELNTKVYGHEMDFEKMQLTLLFGTYRNAYESFNLLMNFMINNEAIISYDYGKGIRYTDVRLIAAPKTELDNGQHMRSKFDFKRLSPFYTIEEGTTLTIKNVHDWDIKPIVSGTVNTNIVCIEAEDTSTSETIGVKFDFTSLTKPFNFYYNAETKQILINGINNGYQYIDFSYGVSFITLPKDTEHIVWTTGITSQIVKAKKWVID